MRWKFVEEGIDYKMTCRYKERRRDKIKEGNVRANQEAFLATFSTQTVT